MVSAAAAAAGMGERTAHRWQRGALPSAAKAPRTWRTREDPFADVWLSEVVPRLVADAAARLQALTLFEWLCEQHPGRFEPGQLRTLQRRVRTWRAQHGPDHEVYFEQVAVPGREAAFDFTDASALGVTIRGVPFPHLLFEWVLSYSGWTYVALALSETFEALVGGRSGGALDAGRGAGGAAARQSVGGDARAEAQWRAAAHCAVPAGTGALRTALVEDSAAQSPRKRGRRAVPLPDENRRGAGAIVAGRHRLRR